MDCGTNEGETWVLHTVDGGAHWQTAKVDAGPGVANIRDVFFLDDHRGWLISWAFNDKGTRLLKTQDGGKTWEADGDGTFQGKGKWLSQVRFINDRIGFAFNSIAASSSEPQALPDASESAETNAENPNQNYLLYTNDGGKHWEKIGIPRMVNHCDVFEGDLLCSAIQGESGLWLLKVHPIAK